MKVLHMADMHLQWPFAGMGPDGRRRREELKDVFTGIIDLAAEQQVDLLLIAGDLFEHSGATRGLIKFIDDQFRRIPRTRVFISPGNHDPYLPGSYYEQYAWAPNVHIFRPEVERVDLDDLPVSVYGWGFGAWEVWEYQLASLRVVDPARLNLVVMHGGDEAYHPFQPADLTAIGADYVALGHIHKPGVFAERFGRVVACYSGSPEPLGFGEPGAHGVYLGTVSKLANQLEFVPLARREYITAEVDVTGAVSLEDLADRIRWSDSEEARLENCYRLTLTGTVDPELVPDVALLTEKLASDFYYLKLADETRPDYDLQAMARERSARGVFVQRLLTMAEEATDPTERSRINRAIVLGLTAFGRKGAVR
ncbi:MAG: metallophosphoesterase family protein [Mycobacterium leprae]